MCGQALVLCLQAHNDSAASNAVGHDTEASTGMEMDLCLSMTVLPVLFTSLVIATS